MYECLFCTSTFRELSESGRCPNCGGPHPRLIPVETASEPALTQPNFKQAVYKKVGFKAVSIFAWLLTGLLGLSILITHFNPHATGLRSANMPLAFLLIALSAFMGQWQASMFNVVLLVLAFVQT